VPSYVGTIKVCFQSELLVGWLAGWKISHRNIFDPSHQKILMILFFHSGWATNTHILPIPNSPFSLTSSLWLYFCLFVCLFVCLSFSVCLSVFLCLSVCLSLFVYLSLSSSLCVNLFSPVFIISFCLSHLTSALFYHFFLSPSMSFSIVQYLSIFLD
jgi:hypothetical protein